MVAACRLGTLGSVGSLLWAVSPSENSSTGRIFLGYILTGHALYRLSYRGIKNYSLDTVREYPPKRKNKGTRPLDFRNEGANAH